MATDDDYDYGALMADSDIDEAALLDSYDPDAVDPDHIEGTTDLVADSVAEEFEPPEEVEADPVEHIGPEGDADAETQEFTPPEAVESDEEPATVVPETAPEPVRALDATGSPVIAVCGLSGGAGTTTFAMLLAFAASKQKRGPVLLTDMGGPSASMAAYVSKRSTHSFSSAANSHRAGLFGADGKAPFAEIEKNLRMMAREPGLADDEIGDPADPYVYDLLIDAQEDHFATVIDCGRLERPAEAAVADRATHIVWVVSGTPAAARRARAALKSTPFRGSRSNFLVVHTSEAEPLTDRSEQDIRHAADSADADIVLCPDAGDIVGQGIEKTAKRALQPVKATLGRIFK